MILLLPLFLAAALPPETCHPVESGSVLARDVAPFIPEFAKLPADFLLGYVLESGAPRVFPGADLERIARNRGLDLHGLPDLCFARHTFVPQPAEIAQAMKKAFENPAVKIEILTPMDHAIPSGELVFPRSGVQGAGPEVTWYGYVQTAETTKIPLTIRARVTATMNRVVAATDLRPGKAILPGQLRLETSEDSPFDQDTVRAIDDAMGFIARANIAKGSPVRNSQVERPKDVAFGDLVRVDVFAGAAHLTLEARAETAGMKGSFITVRNMSSGRSFRAQITGKDKVVAGGDQE
ncbi:MAG TPA: flagellar basal body P-ring formation chaperone FlgA [Bryobacteraceae bacterium]|nr:flagellar basal body P-ring formation chaperone FlgA [Bryobacteraceae bacterium]